MLCGQIKEAVDEYDFVEIGGFSFSKDGDGTYWFSDDGDDLYDEDFEVLIDIVFEYIRNVYVSIHAKEIIDSFRNVEFEDEDEDEDEDSDWYEHHVLMDMESFEQ
ncbi:MAG: hypothetical protein ACRCZ0_04905 [Cetobacterium sp.]